MSLDDREFVKSLAELVKIGVEAERERCISIAEQKAKGWYNGKASTDYGQGYQRACEHIAAAIRAPIRS